MWINEYINDISGKFGLFFTVIIFFGYIYFGFIIDGRYFIKLKKPTVNGFVNFSILAFIFFMIGLLIYFVTIPFYDSNITTQFYYFFSMIFYFIDFCIIILLLCVFFYWIGGGE